MRDTGYGKKIGQALKAVATMHSQVSQLLSDCDSLFPDYEPVFGNIVTSGLTYHLKADFWMARAVYRYWFQQGKPVLGVTAMFRSMAVELEQPLFLVGCIEYPDTTSQNIRQRCDGWHLWLALRDWAPKPLALSEVINLPDPDGKGTIRNMKLIAVPLFEIENLDDVRMLFKRIGVELSL